VVFEVERSEGDIVCRAVCGRFHGQVQSSDSEVPGSNTTVVIAKNLSPGSVRQFVMSCNNIDIEK